MNENELKKEYNNFLQDLNLKSCKKSKNLFIYYFLKNEYDFHGLDLQESEKIQKEIIKMLIYINGEVFFADSFTWL